MCCATYVMNGRWKIDVQGAIVTSLEPSGKSICEIFLLCREYQMPAKDPTKLSSRPDAVPNLRELSV